MLLITLILFGPRLSSADEPLRYFSTRNLKIPVRTLRAGAAPIERRDLWFTTDGGQTWSLAKDVEEHPPYLHFQAPADGQYGFRVTAHDRAGHGESPPQPGSLPQVECVVDVTPPTLEVTNPTAALRIFGGGQVPISWEAHDAHLGPLPVTVTFREHDSHGVWRAVDPEERYPAEHRMPWSPPLASGTIELRIVVEDRAGNLTEWRQDRIDIVPFDGFRGSRLMLAEEFSMFRRFPIHYVIPDLEPVLVERVEIWVREGAASWQLQRDGDRLSPYVFEARNDGVFFFYLRAIDRNNVTYRDPPGPDTLPDLRVVVDTHPPDTELEIGSGAERVFHRAGSALVVRWRSRDENLPERGGRLEVSLDAGDHWQILAENLELRREVGEFSWTPPLIGAEDLRIRMVVEDLARNRTRTIAPTRLHLLNPKLDPAAAAQVRRQRGVAFGSRLDRASLLVALENLDLALQYQPEYAAAWHDRAVVKTRLQRFDEALNDFREARRLAPADISFHLSLVEAHLNVHRVGLDPDGDSIQAARQGLAQVSKVDIYRQEDFRELLTRYRTLESILKEL